MTIRKFFFSPYGRISEKNFWFFESHLSNFIRRFLLKNFRFLIVIPSILKSLDVFDCFRHILIMTNLGSVVFGNSEHNLCLSVGPRMIRFGGFGLTLRSFIDQIKQRSGFNFLPPSVSHLLKSELFAIVSQDVVDSVGKEL